MSKFCVNCGAALEDEARFCGVCGGEQPAAPAPVSVAPSVQQPVQQIPAWQPMQPPAKPKKSKKKFILAGGIAAAVAALALVFVFVILPMLRGGSSAASFESVLVFKYDGNDYYVTPGVFKLNGDDDPTIVSMNYSDGSKKDVAGFNYRNAAKVGDVIYCYENPFLYKYTFTDATTMHAEKLMTEDDFSKCSLSKDVEQWYWVIRNLASDGDYLYFNIVSGVDRRYSNGSIEYKMGRISLETKEITVLDDISAVDFVLYDGWIYYIDPGFYFSDQTGPFGKMDQSRVGVYKARPDGSDKTLLHALSWSDTSGRSYAVADEMTVVGEQLYFTDYSDEGKGRICRMSLSGKDVEYVSKNAAFQYTVDTEHNKVYYTESSYEVGAGSGSVIIESGFFCYDCSNGSETELSRPKLKFLYVSPVYHDGYIYFSNVSDFRFGSHGEGKSVCGMRYNIDTKKFQNLIGYNDGELVDKIDPSTGRKKGVEWEEGKNYLYWQDIPAENMLK